MAWTSTFLRGVPLLLVVPALWLIEVSSRLNCYGLSARKNITKPTSNGMHITPTITPSIAKASKSSIVVFYLLSKRIKP